MISTLVPSYGRDYKSKKSVLEDLNNNKDFRDYLSGQQVNHEDLIKFNVKSVNIRYKQLTQIAVCTFNKNKGLWV